MKRLILSSVIIGFAAATGAFAAGVTSINSAVVTPRVFNDVTNATFTGINNYPTFIAFAETGVSKPTGFANRDLWQYSANGTSPYQFQNADYFYASFNLTLTGSPITPRKEAGFILSTTSGNGDIQFIVNTDGHEVVQFGGISFYSFTGNGFPAYNSGQTINLAIKYFKDSNGTNALQFYANGVASPVFDFPGTGAAGITGIGNGSTLGGYFQIVNDPNNASNRGDALFQNITMIPEPSTLALVGLGSLAVLLRRRS
jgi:hypothetical protein